MIEEIYLDLLSINFPLLECGHLRGEIPDKKSLVGFDK